MGEQQEELLRDGTPSCLYTGGSRSLVNLRNEVFRSSCCDVDGCKIASQNTEFSKSHRLLHLVFINSRLLRQEYETSG